HARELREQIVLFVRGARRANDADGRAAGVFLNSVADLSKALANQLNRFFPRGWHQLAVLADQRLRQPFFTVCKVEGIAALDAKKIAVDAALVAIVAADNLHAGFGPAHPERGFAAVTAVRANGVDVIHLPGTGLIAIRAGSKRTDRADVDAHAALFALEMVILIRRDDGTDTAILHAQSPNIHALAAHAHAPITKDAARSVEVDHRGPLLLFLVVLGLGEFGFECAVGECHVLQFAFAAGIAHRAVKRMVAEQQLKHRLAGLAYFVAVSRDDHPLGDPGGAGGLELGHLLDFHHAHAARALQRKAGVITKGGHFDACVLAGVDQ